MVKDSASKCFQKNKKRSSRKKPHIFCEISGVLKQKKKKEKGHRAGELKLKLIFVWLIFFFTNQKIVLSSSQGQGIFEDL